MIAHPFEIRASAATQPADELMITWGKTPRGGIGTIYLPAVAAAEIIALADKMYVKHLLSAIDVHTIQCPVGDVTLVPIPQGLGRYAGLLAVDLPPAINQRDAYSIAVRQLTLVSATVRPNRRHQLSTLRPVPPRASGRGRHSPGVRSWVHSNIPSP